MKETFLNVGILKIASLWSEAGDLLCCSVVCRECGCTQWNACEGGCAWAEMNLCTSCAPGIFMSPAQMEELRELQERLGVLAV